MANDDNDDVVARGKAAAWALALCGVISGCTPLASSSDRPDAWASAEVAIADAAPAPATDSRWECLGPAAARGVQLRETIVLSLTVRDAASNRGLEGVVVRACNRLDVGCQSPLTTSSPRAEAGELDLELPQGFDGFLELQGDSNLATLFFPGRALMADEREELALLGPDAFVALATSSGAHVDAELGHVLVRAHDCEEARAAGVGVESEGGGQPFAFEDGLPRLGAHVTGSEGMVGFLNVPPGLLVLSAEQLDGARSLGRRSVWVRPGAFTYVDFEPDRWQR